MHHRSLGDKAADTVNIALLAVIALGMLFPFLYIFSVSFSSFQDYIGHRIVIWPKHWVLDAYAYIFSSKAFIRSLLVSTFVTTVGAIVSLLFTSTMAYSLTRNLYGKKLFLLMVTLTLMFTPGIIPLYIVVKETGLLNSWWSLILPAAISPFYLIVMRQFFLGIPQELMEAAHIDGANDLGVFRRIILPLSKPAFAAFGLFYAVAQWNSYFSAIMYLNLPSKWPVQVVLRQMVLVSDPQATIGTDITQQMLNPPPSITIQMAAVLVATLPILLVYPFLQKHFAKGVMLGSVKG
jgi:putative aldouronate transport system permease protein